MKILFSPSESKTDLLTHPPINKDSFCCKNLYDKRRVVIKKYKEILNSNDIERLKGIFGLKDEAKCKELLQIDIETSSTCRAIRRYSGVAYNHLNYGTIPIKYQKYIDKNTIIFSNLFGPILAQDLLPIYKLKQGSTLDRFKTENYYKEHFSHSLDEILKNEFIIDLRAGFYEKFYKIPYPHLTIKFIKNDKIVSHWAKAYRGIVLRNLAINSINSIEDFKNLEIENLKLKEIQQKKKKTEYIYEIF